MSKRHKRKFGISRRIGESLWGSSKDPVHTRNYPPGMHGSTFGYKKKTEYGTQLLAKQKLRKYYGDISEKQFRKIYKEALRRKGDTSQNMIGLLESRLDAFIYRLGVVPTIFAARQFVNHKHLKVNGRSVNIPSYCLKPGDVVEVREKSKTLTLVQESVNANQDIVEYIEFDTKKLSAKCLDVTIIN